MMFSKEAYLAQDYDNLNLTNTRVRIKGKLNTPWFAKPYLEGYIDTEKRPVDDMIYYPAFISQDDSMPIGVLYGYYDRKKNDFYYYASKFIANKKLKRIYVEFYEDNEELKKTNDYVLIAPATTLDDINREWNTIFHNQ